MLDTKFIEISVVVIFFAFNVICEDKLKDKENTLPSFRINAEEVDQNDGLKYHKNTKDCNLVAFLVENVKKIYDDLHGSTAVTDKLGNQSIDSITELQTSTEPENYKNVSVLNPAEVLASNVVISKKIEKTLGINTKAATISNITTKNVKNDSNLRDLMDFETSQQPEQDKNVTDAVDCNAMYEKQLENSGHKRRSCIACDNIVTKDCDDPENKLVPSILCEHENDLCYSMHTPFGIIDRGCYNMNHNISTYVCSCNLCNYISISDMPYVFSNKRDWIDNVVELSRTIRFRKSIFKDMSCLRCEVNVTTERDNMLDNANCLEGNVLSLPTEVCGEDEICAVKAVKSDGYIWRGCAKSPLYNYFWTYCDSDLCNYDSLISLYDFL